jgi:class 3 adenylate cyclase
MDKVLDQCAARLSGVQPDAGILMADIDFNGKQILTMVQERFPGVRLVGGTTSGIFSSALGFSEYSIALLLFASDDVVFHAALGERATEDPEGAIRRAFDSIGWTNSGEDRLCFFLPDGRAGDIPQLMDSVRKELSPGCAVLGGSLGRHSLTDARPQQFFFDEIFEDAVGILVLEGRVPFSYSICNSWDAIGRLERVEESSQGVVRRIGNGTAIDFYRHYLGENRDPAFEFPLAVYEDDTPEFVLRVPVGYDESTGSITFAADVPEGAMVRLSEATAAGILKATESAVQELAAGFPYTPETALAFSCDARKEILGTRLDQELRALQQRLPDPTSILGFYAFSEFAPVHENAECKMHNMTLVSLLLGNRENGVSKAEHTKTTQSAVDLSPEVDIKLIGRKLVRERKYRVDLETLKDNNTALLRKIGQEIDEARMQVQQQKTLLEVLNRDLEMEKEKSDELLKNILPDKVAEELKASGEAKPEFFEDAGVLFTDFKGFTKLAQHMSAQELVSQLDHIFRAFDSLVSDHGIEKLKTIGDAYMCASGLPETSDGHLMDLIDAAWDIRSFMSELNTDRKNHGKNIWPIRIGIHVGPVVAGIIGSKKFAYDIWGDVVNVASRLESNGEPGEINVSQEVYHRIHHKYECRYRGMIETKNHGEIAMYFITGRS